MAIASSLPTTRNHGLAPLLVVLLLSAAFGLLLLNIGARLPDWRQLFTASDADLATIAVRYGLLPRFALSLIAGAALGLSGVLFQQMLRNPLAEPGTLAVFAGAKFSLVAAVLWVPGLLAHGQEPMIILGGMLALGVVALLAARAGFAPLTVILVGLVLSLCLEALSSMFFLTHFEELSDLLVWQTGSLVQDNWNQVRRLFLVLAAGGLVAFFLRKPMGLFDLDEASARSAGASVPMIRLASFATATLLSALVAAYAGIIGFIGLAGPAIARLSGARRLSDRLIHGPLIAAGILAFVDQGVLFLAGGMDVPAGAVTALLGTPLLIWLICRMRTETQQPPRDGRSVEYPRGRASFWFLIAALSLVVTLLLALFVGRLPEGWFIAGGSEIGELLPWRLPRVLAAAGGGIMLAIAGTALQRLTGNGLASPELLGISSGAALILMVAVFLLPPLPRETMMLISAGGAFAVLVFTLWLGSRSMFSPERMLLVGVAIGALSGSLGSLLTLLGDIRVLRLLGWLAGSTYSVTQKDAWIVVALAGLSLAVVPLFGRWLRVLPLGEGVTAAIGVPLAASRLLLLVFTAILTGAATLIMGPLSFAGLAAPHLARISGLRTPLAQVYGAAIIGAIIMVLADWIGRNIAFPWQVPAGIVATLLGGLYFILLAMKR